MNDPHEVHRITQERIAKLEKDKEQAERLAEEGRARGEESRKNEEGAKRLAEKERARAEESRKNEENAKRLADKERGLAEEERRKRLEAEAEVRELRTRLGLQGHG